MFLRVEREATGRDQAEVFHAAVRRSVRPMLAGSLLFSSAAALAATLIVAVGEHFGGSPRRPFLTEWLDTAGWGAAMWLGLMAVLVSGYFVAQRVAARRVRTVASVEASWDTAVVAWGLAEGELDAAFLRVEPGRVWVVEAGSIGLEAGATEGPRSVRGVEAGPGELRLEGSGSMLVRAAEIDGRDSDRIARMVGRVVAVGELPSEVERLMTG